MPSTSNVTFLDFNLAYKHINILSIKNLEYEGEDVVKVILGVNESMVFFEFDNTTASIWEDVLVIGELISFIVPASGQLVVTYTSINPTNLYYTVIMRLFNS